MSTYRVELRALAVNGWAVTTNSLKLSGFGVRWTLNGPGSFDGAVGLDVADADLANVGARELLVYRDDVPIWGGYLTNIDVDRQRKQVRVGGDGYWSRARRRLVRSNVITSAGGVSPHALAWTLLTQTQGQTSGSLGWTQGASNASTGSVYRELCADSLPNIGGTIESLSSDGYFDFAVLPTTSSASASNVAAFTTWTSRGSDKTSTVQFTGSNTMFLRYSKSADGIATFVDGVGVDNCSPPHVTSSANMATYGRLEADPLDIDTGIESEVSTSVSEYLTANKKPIWSADVGYYDGNGPSFSAFDIGDTVRISPNDSLSTNLDLRVVERELSVEPTQAGLITVSCEERPA